MMAKEQRAGRHTKELTKIAGLNQLRKFGILSCTAAFTFSCNMLRIPCSTLGQRCPPLQAMN